MSVVSARSKKRIIVDEEIPLEEHKYIMSKTDKRGFITYANDYFIEISGYSKEELVGANHNIVRHPDMPKIIFRLLWERILKGENIYAIVKNLAKDGRYYWVLTDFEIEKNKLGRITGFYAFRKSPPKKAVEKIIPLYRKLLELEKKGGIESSSNYLKEFLKEKNLTYDEYIDYLLGNSSVFKLWFKSMQKFFR